MGCAGVTLAYTGFLGWRWCGVGVRDQNENTRDGDNRGSRHRCFDKTWPNRYRDIKRKRNCENSKKYRRDTTDRIDGACGLSSDQDADFLGRYWSCGCDVGLRRILAPPSQTPLALRVRADV